MPAPDPTRLSWLRQWFERVTAGETRAQRDGRRADLPGFHRVACPSCERRLALHEDRIGDIIRCDEDTADGCPAELLVTCEAYDKVTPEGGPARLRLLRLRKVAGNAPAP